MPFNIDNFFDTANDVLNMRDRMFSDGTRHYQGPQHLFAPSLGSTGLSGGISFGNQAKLPNVWFWLIAAVVIIAVVRPFDALFKTRKKR